MEDLLTKCLQKDGIMGMLLVGSGGLLWYTLKDLGGKIQAGNIEIAKIATSIETLIRALQEERTALINPLLEIVRNKG